mgnify:FL=1
MQFLKFTQNAIKQVGFLTLPKETKTFLKQIAEDARETIESGSLDVINAQIKQVQKILEIAPRSAEIM